METSRTSRLSVYIFFADTLLNPLGMLAATWLRGHLPLGRGGALPEAFVEVPWFLYLLGVACWIAGLALSGAYEPQRILRWYREAAVVAQGAALGTFLLAGVVYFTFRELSRLQFVYYFVLTLGLLLGQRAALRIVYRLRRQVRPGWRDRVLIVGAGVLGQRVARAVLDHSRWGLHLVGYLDDAPAKQGLAFEGAPVLGTLEALERVVRARGVEEVWVALPPAASERLKQLLVASETLPVRVKIIPDYLSLALVRARVETLAGIPLIGLREPVITGSARLAKRAFDLAVGGAALLLLSPLLGLIAVLIRLTSPGPALLRQPRAGENGRPFEMLKFRTMVTDAEQRRAEVLAGTLSGQPVHKRPDDPRVTPLGRFLRRYSLDELPQLVNVLKGEMSLVGPRPELPWLVESYEPWQRKRFAVPQGLTGWWQINGRSDRPMHLNTQDDLYYVYNYSLWLDIWILLRTPLAVLRGQGAF